MLTAEVPCLARFTARSRPDSPAPMIAILVIRDLVLYRAEFGQIRVSRPNCRFGRPAHILGVHRVAKPELVESNRRTHARRLGDPKLNKQIQICQILKTGHQSRRKSALQLKKIQQNEEEFLCEPSKKRDPSASDL